MKYEEFAKLEELVEKIRRDIEAIVGHPVYKAPLKNPGYHLSKICSHYEKVFARVRPRKREMLCRVSSQGKWVDKAGVRETANHIISNGHFGTDDLLLWYIKSDNNELYKEVIRALARICRER